jgi:hypothetical protein
MHYTCMFRWQLVATPITAYLLWARSSTFSVVAIGMAHHKHVDLRAVNNSCCRAARTTVALCIHVYTDPADRKHRHARLRTGDHTKGFCGLLHHLPEILQGVSCMKTNLSLSMKPPAHNRRSCKKNNLYYLQSNMLSPVVFDTS